MLTNFFFLHSIILNTVTNLTSWPLSHNISWSPPPWLFALYVQCTDRRKEENRTIWWNCHNTPKVRPAVLESPLQLEHVLFLKAQLQTAQLLWALFRLIQELFFSALLELRCWSCFSHFTSEVLQYSVLYYQQSAHNGPPVPLAPCCCEQRSLNI